MGDSELSSKVTNFVAKLEDQQKAYVDKYKLRERVSKERYNSLVLDFQVTVSQMYDAYIRSVKNIALLEGKLLAAKRIGNSYQLKELATREALKQKGKRTKAPKTEDELMNAYRDEVSLLKKSYSDSHKRGSSYYFNGDVNKHSDTVDLLRQKLQHFNVHVDAAKTYIPKDIEGKLMDASKSSMGFFAEENDKLDKLKGRLMEIDEEEREAKKKKRRKKKKKMMMEMGDFYE